MMPLSAAVGFSRMTRGLGLAVAAVVVAMPLGARSALAQTPSMADVAAISGPNRQERLIAGAKTEGELIYYSSAVVEDSDAFVGAFEKKYGINVQVWRGST
jgi:iron(III) transport system substrate-binding protein